MRRRLPGPSAARALLPLAALAAASTLFVSGVFHLHPPIGWVDPGLYIYWFLQAPENVAHRILEYQGARLSYVLPGRLLYQALDPVVAQRALVTGYFLLGLLALHLIARVALESPEARALLVLMVAMNPLWVGAFARGYVDGPSMALGLLALTCLLRPQTTPSPLAHAAAGALLALAASAHLFGGAMAGAAAIAIGLIRATSWRDIVVNGVAGLAGALACLLALGLAAIAIGLPFLFFAANGSPLQLSLDGTFDGFAQHPAEWIARAPRLLLVPTIALLLLTALPAIGRGGRQRTAMAAAALAALLPMLAWLPRSTGVLQHHFYASYLLISLVLAMALWLARVEAQGAMPGCRGVALLGGAVALLIVLGARVPAGWREWWPFLLAGWAMVGGGLAVIAVLAVTSRWRRAVVALPLTLTVLGSLNADTAGVHRLPGGPDPIAQHTGLARMRAFLDATGGTDGRYLVWFGRERFAEARRLTARDLYPLRFADRRLDLHALDSLAASLGWYRAAIGFAMPAFDDREGLKHAGAVGTDAVALFSLCAEPADCWKGHAALAEIGLSVERGPFEVIDLHGLPRFTVARAQLTNMPDAPLPRRGQAEAVLARLVRLDALEASGTLQPLSSAERARTPLPLASVTEGPVPTVLSTTCAGDDPHLACVIRYIIGDGPPLERHVVFERIRQIAVPVEAGPAVPAPLPR